MTKKMMTGILALACFSLFHSFLQANPAAVIQDGKKVKLRGRPTDGPDEAI